MVFLVLLLVVVSGSALAMNRIGYPFRGPGYDAKKGLLIEQDSFVVAVTSGEITDRRKDFFGQLQQVMNSLSSTDGLVGYAVQKEIVGRRVWTQSVWTSEEELEEFLRSTAHREAVREGGIPRSTVQSVVVSLPATEVPLAWGRVRELLATPEG